MHIVEPEGLGFSSQRLARINTAMQRYVDEKKLAGIVTLIARCGKVVHFEKFGMADIEAGRPHPMTRRSSITLRPPHILAKPAGE